MVFLLTVPTMSAGTIFFGGDLRINATVTDCGSGCTLSALDSDSTWAQWAAVVESFTVLTPSTMQAVTFGYGGGTRGTGAIVAAGGLEPCLSLFDAGGNFLNSTYFGTTCPPGANTIGGACLDVMLDGGLLAPGTYQIALSAYLNMSFAENLGTGTLADGFTGLGNLASGENLNYAFDVNLTPTTAPVPEPATLSLLGGGVAAIWRRKSKA